MFSLRYAMVLISLALLSCYNSNDVNVNYEKQDVNEINADVIQIGWRKVSINGFWAEPPDIVVCDRITTKIKIANALNFWRRIGYSFGTITVVDNIVACSSIEYGKIKIMLPTNIDMKNNLAVTQLYRYTQDKQNLHAVISIYPFAANNRLVLEHEIGHALGWHHSSQRGHIMFPEYESLGNQSQNVRYSDYLNQQRISAEE